MVQKWNSQGILEISQCCKNVSQKLILSVEHTSKYFGEHTLEGSTSGCSTEEIQSYVFATTRGWVNDERIFTLR